MKLHGIKKGHVYLGVALALQIVSLLLMAYDSSPQGFGIMTLWIGAPLLLVGLLLPIPAFLHIGNRRELSLSWKSDMLQTLGFLLSFLVALVVYIITLEPTASLWDCAETIAAAFKLQVPHTPGVPMTVLMGRIFSMLALGDVHQVAWYINLMSGVFSAGAVALTFLLIWHFGTSIIESKKVLFAASFAGSLCLAFSDSFWFSAVEAETYGPSIFCMLLLMWLSVKGQNLDPIRREKRIKLIAYLTGLAYCVHPMCILVLPVCFLLWKTDPEFKWKSSIVWFGAGVLVILFINKVVAVDFFEWIFQLDLLMVNSWSMPFYSGVVGFVLLVSMPLVVVWRKFEQSRLAITSVMLLILGFAPYLMLFVRSAKQPTINEFTPSNLAKIKPYMNRESYPSRPLLYGPYFDAELQAIHPKAKAFVKDAEKYTEVGELVEYEYEEERMTIFPRIYSNEARHQETYREWAGLNVGQKPRFVDNVKFFWKYQLGHMYARYVMWNFAGRSGDQQHAAWLAPWEGLSDTSDIYQDKARNQYFMIPLLIGIVGFLFQAKKDRNGFVSQLSFFLITGILLVVYLNGTPNEPRERDYIYVGSYVAFCIWIGLGLIALLKNVQRQPIALLVVISFLLPGWMLFQNWDDHDRSGRTFQMDHARNMLASCEKDALLFTGGDNDTFPLWYLQEVEGFRTDVRVMVMTYFNADWYINQLTRQYYDSPPLDLTLKTGENQYGPFDPLYIQEVSNASISWDRYMDALKAESPQLQVESASGGSFFYLPSRNLELQVGEEVLQLNVSGRYLPKSELAILDILQTNGWERPVYFNFTGLSGLNVDIQKYLIQEGLVYRVTPNESEGEIPVDLDRTYHNLVERANYSNLARSDVYFNHEDFESRMVAPLKFTFNELITIYLQKDAIDQAKELATFALDKLYFDHLEPSYSDVQFASILSVLEMPEVSEKLNNRAFNYFYDRVDEQIERGEMIARNDLIILQQAGRYLKDSSLIDKYINIVKRLEG